MRLIQKSLASYPVLQGIQTIATREFRGVNTLDPYSIGDEFFTDMRNLVTDDYPAIKTRPGYTRLGSKIGSRVLGLGVWKDQELHAIFNDGTWRKWTGSTWQTLLNGLNTSADWTFTNFKGNLDDVNLIGCNGVNGLYRYDGSTVQKFGDAKDKINFITTYQNRLWGAWENELHASALNQPDKWQLFEGTEADSYYIVIETDRGEDINMLSGGLRKLTIGMRNSLHELYGGVPSDFNTHMKTNDVGFINNKSAVTQDGVLRFMHELGIYEFAGGLLPDDSFSEIVKKYIKVDDTSVSGTDGEKIYFYTNGVILVYDPAFQTWCVWDHIQPSHFALFKNELYIGTRSGEVLKMGGSTDNGTAIQWRAVTKPYNNLTPSQRTRWHKLYVTVDLPQGSTFRVYGTREPEADSGWVLLKSVSGGNLQQQRIFVPVRELANEHYVRLKFEGQGPMKLYGFTRHVRVMPLV